MCSRNKLIGLIASALGIGVFLAVVLPSWLLVWILGVLIVAVGILLLIK